METSFPLDDTPLLAHPETRALAAELAGHAVIDSRRSFNDFCQAACGLWKTEQPPTPHLTALLGRIGQGVPNIIATGWGGVVIERHEHPEVEKYLVVRRGRYLALEKHELKDEHLEVREGAGLLLWRHEGAHALSIHPLAPGDRFHLEPGMEHCLIGTGDLLVYETSTDPKGMDQDLIFLYEPDAAP